MQKLNQYVRYDSNLPICLQGRVQAAKNMVEKLLRDANVGEYVQEMKTLCDAYIQLANWNVSQYKAETSKCLYRNC